MVLKHHQHCLSLPTPRASPSCLQPRSLWWLPCQHHPSQAGLQLPLAQHCPSMGPQSQAHIPTSACAHPCPLGGASYPVPVSPPAALLLSWQIHGDPLPPSWYLTSSTELYSEHISSKTSCAQHCSSRHDVQNKCYSLIVNMIVLTQRAGEI